MSAKDLFYSEGKDFSNAEERAFAREGLVYNVTEDILLVLEDLDVSKKELARRLGKSRSYVTQVLGGARNMTLGSLSDICFALGVKPKVVLSIESEIDISEVDKVAHWEVDDVELKTNTLIQKAENVFDYRDRSVWEKQVA